MATRLKEGMIPYTGGIGIEITDNHVINVLLRALNNLIHVNEDRELYVDLQLEDGIQPEDDFPVGVTTGRILEEDGWPQNATILNWKTTSGDYVRLIYAADDKLYYDPGTGEWRLLATWEMVEEALTDSNTKTFWIEDNQDLENAQAAYDWYMDGKSPILMHEGLFGMQMLTLGKDETNGTTHILAFAGGEEIVKGSSDTAVKAPIIQFQAEDGEVQNIIIQYWREFDVLETGFNYSVPYTPQYPGSPATKKYVDDGLALKQDILTAGTNITIDQNNVISATLPSALVYKGNVQTINDLPSSGQTVGDTYFVEGVDGMYSWDGTQWNYVGSTSPSLTNYFNMTINDSDDITEGSVHLFCSTSEKNYWNSKQDALTAGANIQISNNVISATDTTYSAGTAMELVGNTFNNTKPFDPENSGTLSQVLKKTSTGYRWANEANAVTSVNGQTGDVIVDEFDPENAGTTGQVLKKTSTGYAWANESGGGGGGGTEYTGGNGISVNNSTHVITNTKPFEPSTGGTTGQVLTKTDSGYAWVTGAGGGSNVRCFEIDMLTVTSNDLMEIVSWVNTGTDYGAIIKDPAQDGVFIYYETGMEDGNVVYYFMGTRYYADTTTTVNGQFSTLQNQGLKITYSNGTYTAAAYGLNSYANFLKVEDSGYTTPYMPTADYQPTTKAYVDSRNWVGTQAQYDQLTPEQGVIYNIIPSS